MSAIFLSVQIDSCALKIADHKKFTVAGYDYTYVRDGF